jgi:hypothetical protein
VTRGQLIHGILTAALAFASASGWLTVDARSKAQGEDELGKVCAVLLLQMAENYAPKPSPEPESSLDWRTFASLDGGL